MTSALQNRLVGTIIIVALAVIFLPDFLDGEKSDSQDTFATVPVAPAKKPILNPEPFPTDRVSNAAQRPIEVVSEPAMDEQLSQVVPEVAEQTNGDQPDSQDQIQDREKPPVDDLAQRTVVTQPADINENVGWVVQLGSFRHDKNVKQLLSKLESAGYRAFSRPIQTSSGPLTKVFVGPDLKKDNLEKALPHLQDLTGLKGKITTFSVD